MDAADRLKESLLDAAWVGQALELFADELRDLELLEEEEEKGFQAELQRLHEVTAETTLPPSVTAEPKAMNHERKDTSRSKKYGSPQIKRGAAERTAGTAGGTAKGTSGLSQLIKEKEAAMKLAREREFWYRSLNDMKKQMQNAREEADRRRAHARRQLRFFNTRSIDEYMMEEILQGVPGMVSKGKSTLADATSDELHSKDAVSEEGSVTVFSTETPITDAPVLRARSGCPDALETECEFTIDAVGFARDLNASLEKEYGFRPVLSTTEDKSDNAATTTTTTITTSTSTTTTANMTISQLKSKLLTHAPGDLMGIGESWSLTLPPVVSTHEGAAAPPRSLHTTNEKNISVSLPAIIYQVDGGVTDSDAFSPFSPPPPTATTTADGAIAATPRASTIIPTSLGEAGTAPKVTTGKQLHRVLSKTKARSGRFAHIECSAEDNRVKLRTTVGAEVSKTVRFINREPNRLCVRIPPSKHAWITYSMVKSSVDRRVSPASALPFSSVKPPQPPPSSSSSFLASAAMTRIALSEPLGCGGFVDVRITFKPQSATEPLVKEVLRLGHCRDLNSRNGEGEKWHFFDVNVTCETVFPQFSLIPINHQRETGSVSSAAVPSTGKRSHFPQMPEQAVTTVEFPYTYVMETCSRQFYLENTGSVAMVTLSSTSSCFKIDPSPEKAILLSGGDRVEITVFFSPIKEMRYDAEELIVTVREVEEGPVIAEHRFRLCGEGALPRVDLVRVGTLELSAPQQDASVPQYMVPGTAPGVETKVLVVVHNRGHIGVPYFWRTDNIGGGSPLGGVQLSVTPATGVLPPEQESVFLVCLRPAAAQPLAAVLNLFLEGLPMPRVAEEAAVSDLYVRGRPIPAVLAAEEVQTMSDPYSVFQRWTREQPKDCSGVFATGFYLFADPVTPSLVMIPDHLEEGVECLVNCRNLRRITMKNNSPRLLHFCLDPNPDECPPEVVLSERDREFVEVGFEPRKGCVPPYADVTVLFQFTLREVGHHLFVFDCYIPELMELLTTTSTASATEGTTAPPPTQTGMIKTPPTTELYCTHQLYLSVTGVGPSVSVSTNCLDFGSIELGAEAEASFTVSNDNPIAIVFDLQDPTMQEKGRFVFLPPSARLGAGESVEVTVYRQAVELGDSQAFFELIVRGGDTLAIETNATIQASSLFLEEAVVDFGVVPEGAWVEQDVVVSNPSAFDVFYVVELAVVPPCINIIAPPPGVVRAGYQGIHIPIRCAFEFHPGEGKKEALMVIKNTRTRQELLVELRCERVQQLCAAINLIPVPKAAKGPGSMAYTPPVLSCNLPPPPTMEISHFIEALLWNLVEQSVMDEDVHCSEGKVTDVSELNEAERQPAVLRSYCPPVLLKAYLPDKEPVWSELLALRVSNQSSCHGSYAVEALRYSLKGLIEGSTEMSTKGKPHAATATATTASTTTLCSGRLSGKRYHSGKSRERKRRRQLGRDSSSGTGRTGKSDVNFSLGAVERAFWCKGIDGTEEMERERRAMLFDAQKILLDGRGCATMFGNAPVGLLHPNATVEVPLSIFANLPGRYEETLQVRCGKLPYTHIPLTLELSGKPVVLDSNTAGLTVLGGRELVRMPAVIAGVGRSWRSMVLINRIPRDLTVSVKIFLTTATFSVVAVDEEVDAAAVTLQLQPVSGEEQRRESEGKGKVAASPENLFLPALASREVIIEYAPDATFVPKESASEREWRGGVIITAEVADTPFNDGFLINEFYRLHAARYPVVGGVMKRKRLRESVPKWMRSIVRPIMMLNVQQPLISRPGVVKNNAILLATPGELTVLKKHFAMSKSQSCGTFMTEDDKSNMGNQSQRHTSRGSYTKWSEDKGEEDESEDTSLDEESQDDYQDETLVSEKPLEVILAIEEERKALHAFMEQRKLEMAEHSRHYFIPIELEVRARCGVAQLTVEPSGDVIRFPQYVEDAPCVQTVRLTNLGCAAMEFILDVTSSFLVASAQYISKNTDEDLMEVDDEEEARKRRAIAALKWVTREERQSAQRILRAAKRPHSADMAITEVKMANVDCIARSRRRGGDAAFVTVTKYRLHPNDALEVQLEYCKPSKQEVHVMMQRGSIVQGALNIMYFPSDGVIKDSTAHEGGTPHALCPPPVQEVTQNIPIVLSFSSPSVRCSPSMLWFHPGQLLHDGRPQPSYAQKIRLLSSYPSAVTFVIVPSCQIFAEFFSATTAPFFEGVTGTHAYTRSTAPQAKHLLTRERHIKEVKHYWMEDEGDGGVKGGDGEKDGSETDVDSTGGDMCSTECEKPQPMQLEQEKEQQHRRSQKQSVRQKEERQLVVVEDTERFTITPMQGTIPGATRGGQPGVCEISVVFKEHMNVRFEAVYDVLINDSLVEGCCFGLRGDSRVTEI
ncbi:hypothetical protein MOQ_005384 [Trypanosoma cruzi marinkellei]|uniref:Abnormal spindle-like microcephaly-associated protein ASH domain-containing protein n=1 Tax=Trypanosoma cruzi marinkellei TaxID=85056 RepID=K2M729_TRYCR|nr:hypothetical protein MOQ_005384 [Trypanosoma cruzi marinkellei]